MNYKEATRHVRDKHRRSFLYRFRDKGDNTVWRISHFDAWDNIWQRPGNEVYVNINNSEVYSEL